MTANVAIRLGTTGRAEVEGDLAAIGLAGEASAKRIAAGYNRASDDVATATARLAQAQERQAAARAKIEAVNLGGGGDALGSNVRPIELTAAAIERLRLRAEALVGAIDPAYAAQVRFNREMGEAKTLIAANAITLDQYAAKLRAETALLGQTANAQGRVTASTGQLRAGSQQLAYQISDVATSFAGGINPMVIFAQQGSQVVQSLALMKGESVGLIGFLGGPWGAALLGAVSILGVLGAKYFESASASDVMRDHQQELAKFIDQTTGRIKEQSAALLINQAIQAQGDAKKARQAADDAKARLIAASRPQVIAGAGDSVGEMVNPDPRILVALNEFNRSGNADALSRRLDGIARANPGLRRTTDGLIALSAAYVTANRTAQQNDAQQRLLSGTARPGDRRVALGQFGSEAPDLALADAQAKLAAATTKQERASAQATVQQIQARKAYDDGSITLATYTERMAAADRLVNQSKDHTDRHAASLGRQAAAMSVNAIAGLDLARAYLAGGDASLKAEAARKGLTEATRKGINGDAQVSRQLAILVADQLVQDAKAVSVLRDQTSARKGLNDQISAGAMVAADANRALADEAALRPLLKLRIVAQGEAQELLNRTIREYRAALADAHAEEDRGAALRAIRDAGERVQEIKAQIRDLSKDASAQAINAADRAAGRQADSLNLSGPARSNFLDAEHQKAVAEDAARRAAFVDSTYRRQQDGLELTQRELDLVGMSADKRNLILERLQREQGIKAVLGTLNSDAAKQLLLQGDYLAENNLKVKTLGRSFDELQRFGDQFVDIVFNPDNWKNFGDLGKTVLKQLADEFLKLAVLNPLKKLLFGGGDDGGGGGFFGKLFGSILGSVGGSFKIGSSTILKSSFDLGALGRNATGTEFFGGGPTWVGENGPEIVFAPTGSKIASADASRRAALQGGQGINLTYAPKIDARGADSEAIARIERQMAKDKREFNTMVISAVNEGRERRYIR